ncbi:unnamed protein product [Acanthoscelides obtectus]|uniref:Uncharacterized protein n=1 Tax=Acanthoscelides obtectus TaxID=200917 RepID=A0A9P0VNS4_ACAOB|nr:unnamed protein product [Acanthoscelides obtectus]CAK1684792.1 hypothetical protein AOBTE_LOCUS35125 [Acanthoscelides obtectus]
MTCSFRNIRFTFAKCVSGASWDKLSFVKFTCFIMDLWLKTGVLKKTAISATDAEMQGSNSNSICLNRVLFLAIWKKKIGK